MTINNEENKFFLFKDTFSSVYKKRIINFKIKTCHFCLDEAFRYRVAENRT